MNNRLDGGKKIIKIFSPKIVKNYIKVRDKKALDIKELNK